MNIFVHVIIKYLILYCCISLNFRKVSHISLNIQYLGSCDCTSDTQF